ncbi:MAG: WG repeat-containing protein [Clostridia bacterium]
MFCEQCGTKNEDTSIFCENCGANLDMQKSNNVNSSVDFKVEKQKNISQEFIQNKEFMLKEKKKSKTSLFIVIAVILVAVLGVGGFFGVNAYNDKKYSDLVDTGNKYLEELKYQEAVDTFILAIDIKPKKEPAYIGAADSYIGLGEPEKAKEILEKGKQNIQLPDVLFEEKVKEVEIIIETPKIDETKFIIKNDFDFDKVYPLINYIMENKYQEEQFSDFKGLSFVTKNGQMAMIDAKGNILIPYRKSLDWCMEGVVDEEHTSYNSIGEINGGYGHGGFGRYMYDMNLKIVIYDNSQNEYTIQNISECSGTVIEAVKFKEGTSFINQDNYGPDMYTSLNKYVYIKSDGTTSETLYDYPEIVTPKSFFDDDNCFYGENTILLKKDNKWGYIDKMENIIIPFQYDLAFQFSNGLAAVKKDGKAGYINEKGETIIDFFFEETTTPYNGTAWVKHNGKWGVYKLS